MSLLICTFLKPFPTVPSCVLSSLCLPQNSCSVRLSEKSRLWMVRHGLPNDTIWGEPAKGQRGYKAIIQSPLNLWSLGLCPSLGLEQELSIQAEMLKASSWEKGRFSSPISCGREVPIPVVLLFSQSHQRVFPTGSLWELVSVSHPTCTKKRRTHRSVFLLLPSLPRVLSVHSGHLAPTFFFFFFFFFEKGKGKNFVA